MKRIILGIACMAALGAGSMNAQNNNCNPANCNQTQCVTAANCNQAQCMSAANCDLTQCVNTGKNCPFANLNLTDAQKQQIQALNQKYDTQKTELKKDIKTRNDAAKTEYRKQARQMQEQRLADIKKILTPEQYTQYLENSYMSRNHKAKDIRKGDSRGHRHHNVHKGCKGGRFYTSACSNNDVKKDLDKQDKNKK